MITVQRIINPDVTACSRVDANPKTWADKNGAVISLGLAASNASAWKKGVRVAHNLNEPTHECMPVSLLI